MTVTGALRARNRAADLAHTLKTPLQALRGETGRLRDQGAARAADAIDEIVDTIRSRVDRELGRARIGGEGPADLAQVAAKVAAVLRRTPRGEEVVIRVDVPPGLTARIDPYDLTEALGSVAENALRHAVAEVRLSARPEGRQVDLCVEDDGPGLPEDLIARMTRRGESLEQDGTGLGLALARDIAEAAEGELRAANRSGGGFRVTLRLWRLPPAGDADLIGASDRARMNRG